jgi:hypothetical protein
MEVIVVLLLLALAGYYIYNTEKPMPNSPTTPAIQSAIQQLKNSNCVEGIDGINGDKFCSSYHGSTSTCRPSAPGNYPDGCFQSSQTHL